MSAMIGPSPPTTGRTADMTRVRVDLNIDIADCGTIHVTFSRAQG